MTPFSARVPLVIGFAAIALLVGGLAAWSLTTQISGAILARGIVKVETDRQIVQHPDGGVVGLIAARDGDLVRQGDVVLRLDDTFLLSELAIVERQLLEISARKARLEAERDGGGDLSPMPDADYTLLDRAWIDAQIEGQRSLFRARTASLSQERDKLREQEAQVDRQIDGITAQLRSMEAQLDLVTAERTDLEGLLDRGLVPSTRVIELKREEARMSGEVGRLIADIAEAGTRRAALGIEVLKLDENRREGAITELRDLDYAAIELEERRINLVERLARLDLRAPVSGIVFGSRVFTVGSVIRAADPVLYVVPGEQPLQISVRIDPVDIDQVYPQQDVILSLVSFSRRTTPEIAGRILRVSADAVSDTETGERYYEGIVIPDADALAALTDISLLPGMPVEAFIRTEERSPIDYLTQPLTVYFGRAFRES